MKLIKYYAEISALPVDRLLRKFVLNRRLRMDIVFAADDLPVNLTKVRTDVTVTGRDISTLTERVKSKYHELDLNRSDYLIEVTADLETRDFKSVLEDPTCNIKLVTPELLKELPEDANPKLTNDLDKESKAVFYAVGRTNGPTDTVINDYQQEDFRVRYDVNSRIEILLDGYKLTFTFRPQRTRNMAKLILPDAKELVIRESDFDLWLLGLYVLTNDYNDVRSLMQDLINQYKEK